MSVEEKTPRYTLPCVEEEHNTKVEIGSLTHMNKKPCVKSRDKKSAWNSSYENCNGAPVLAPYNLPISATVFSCLLQSEAISPTILQALKNANALTQDIPFYCNVQDKPNFIKDPNYSERDLLLRPHPFYWDVCNDGKQLNVQTELSGVWFGGVEMSDGRNKFHSATRKQTRDHFVSGILEQPSSTTCIHANNCISSETMILRRKDSKQLDATTEYSDTSVIEHTETQAFISVHSGIENSAWQGKKPRRTVVTLHVLLGPTDADTLTSIIHSVADAPCTRAEFYTRYVETLPAVQACLAEAAQTVEQRDTTSTSELVV